MQGRAAGTATTIMQRFLKGSEPHKLTPMPVVIGMSATAARFNTLVGDTTSSLQKVVISPAQVRASGLLKERIIITYPDDPSKHGDMAVLQAATDEWINKCKHWYQYTYEQHYPNVNPVFVIQVAAGSGKKISDTDLSDVIAKVEERLGEAFKEGEVVHTFGSTGTIEVNGLAVPHIEPSEIADNRKVRVVMFKENLSTGWDCPRAETMMSFRHAEDATYIAQLLGRMIRTPLQSKILVDDSLNDVQLYLPYFNKDNVQQVIDELQAAEGGDIPTEINGEPLEEQIYVPWTVHTKKPRTPMQIPGQIDMFTYAAEQSWQQLTEQMQARETFLIRDGDNSSSAGVSVVADGPSSGVRTVQPQADPLPAVKQPVQQYGEVMHRYEQLPFMPGLDREAVIRFINEQGFLTYMVKSVKINSYLKSLLSLAGILTQNLIYVEANDEIKAEVVDLMHQYIVSLRKNGIYDSLAKQVMEYKLSIQIFDAFGEAIKDYTIEDWLATTETDLDRQLRAADARLGGYGFPFAYGRKYVDMNNINAFKVDCILFASDDECMRKLNSYAEKKFHELNDQYRKYVVSKSEKCRKQYSDIIADGDMVSKHNFNLPETISARVETGGKTYRDHLFADEDGNATIKLNGWESGVLEEEQRQSDFVCWLRNPSRQSWSLCIPYEIEGETKATYPDFIVIRKDSELGYVMDILEPHNSDFKDNLGKAKGFARYAMEEPRIGRIQLIRMSKDAAGKNRFLRLDMSKGAVRNKVLSAVNTDELDHYFETDGEFLN